MVFYITRVEGGEIDGFCFPADAFRQGALSSFSDEIAAVQRLPAVAAKNVNRGRHGVSFSGSDSSG